MLAFAILISLLGIANTLSMAVHERRHEIGLLRAVGQTRRQTRSVLRLESAIVATFGTTLGLLAARRPARRSARVDILDAVNTT